MKLSTYGKVPVRDIDKEEKEVAESTQLNQEFSLLKSVFRNLFSGSEVRDAAIRQLHEKDLARKQAQAQTQQEEIK